MSSSKFSSPFFQKSPILGAYVSGADAVFAPSDAEHFKDLSNKITGGSLAAIGGIADKEKNKKFADWVAKNPNSTSETEEYRAEYTRIYGGVKPTKPRTV
tara:strand:- start:99 stop:398 length:300 start_codon:yes stop_codon:yes gene_type:complete